MDRPAGKPRPRSHPRPLLLAAAALALACLAACGGPEPAPPPPPPPPPPVSGPATVLDLANWKLTLPTGAEGEPEEIHPPALMSFSGDWFRLNDTGDGVVFTAPAGGVTTSGSSYPRAELRELDGGELASWSNRTGTHTMQLREAITRLPEVKPHVVAAQIHDAENDVLMVRLEDTHLFVEYADGDGEFTLDEDYRLGTPYDLGITAQDGRVQVTYNGEVKGDVALAGEGWYFKAGTYTQSNPERGDAPDAAGEVVIYALDVTHTP